MSQTNPNIDKIIKVEHYIVTHVEKRIKIEDLINHFHLSDSALTKGFKALYGTTIHRYHLQKSMERALAELKKGEEIKVLAIRFGYNHPWSFARAFKSIHKVSPLSYKRNLSNNAEYSTKN